MSKVVTSVKSSAVDSLTAQNRRLLAAAVNAGQALEKVADGKVYRAVVTAHTLKVATGLSGNAVAELIAMQGGASRATTARLIAVGNVLASEEIERYGKDAAVAIAGALYYIAGRGKAFDGGTGAIAQWLGTVSADMTGVDALASAQALAKHVSARESAPTQAPRRSVAGEAGNGGKSRKGDTEPSEPSAPTVSRAAAVATLPSRIAALADELTGLKSDAVAPALADALADLVAVAESLISGIDADVYAELDAAGAMSE